MNTETQPFDLFRLSKSKAAVDLCPNTLRAYHGNGLPFYQHGRLVFVSRTEVQRYIQNPESFKKPAPSVRAKKGK